MWIKATHTNLNPAPFIVMVFEAAFRLKRIPIIWAYNCNPAPWKNILTRNVLHPIAGDIEPIFNQFIYIDVIVFG